MPERSRPLKQPVARRLLLLTAWATIPLYAWAQLPEPGSSGTSTAAPAVEAKRPAYNILRFNEDWSVLRYPAFRRDWLDPIKYVPFSAAHPERFLTLGGEFRGTYENVRNDNFTQQPLPNYSFGMQRFQLFADIHLDPRLRLFLQLESGLEQGRSGGPRIIDAKRLDFLNAFADVRPSLRRAAPRLRVGRQELNFGSGRLVSVREGPNVRQAFYGMDLHSDVRRWSLDGFAVRPAKDSLGYFDNVPLHTTQFWGVFTTRSLARPAGGVADLYYLGLDRKSATFEAGTAREVRQTVGGRIAVPAPVKPTLLPHFDVEAVYQFGHFGSRPVHAWTLSGELGYAFNNLPLKPRPGVRLDVSSGDGGNSSKALGTFNPIFPLGNYFGVIADTGPGPVNFRDVHPDVRLAAPHNVSLDLDWIVYWRQSLHDGVYTVPGSLLTAVPAGSEARFVGHRPGVEARWQATPHAYLQADYGIFYAGEVLRAAGRPHHLNYASLWMGYKF